jgi:hypothetical protein
MIVASSPRYEIAATRRSRMWRLRGALIAAVASFATCAPGQPAQQTSPPAQAPEKAAPPQSTDPATAEKSAPAKIAERPQWQVGDRWVFKSNVSPPRRGPMWERRIVSIREGGVYRVVDERKATYEFDANGNEVDRHGDDFSRKPLAFPLEIGKRWTHQRKVIGPDFNGVEKESWEVKAYEKLSVPAGEYECFRIEGVASRTAWRAATPYAKGGNRPGIETTIWYCPDVRWVAKWESRTQSASGTPDDPTISELVKFEPGS